MEIGAGANGSSSRIGPRSSAAARSPSSTTRATRSRRGEVGTIYITTSLVKAMPYDKDPEKTRVAFRGD